MATEITPEMIDAYERIAAFDPDDPFPRSQVRLPRDDLAGLIAHIRSLEETVEILSDSLALDAIAEAEKELGDG